MQIEIDPISEIPLYQQLRDRVVEGIAAGRLRPGDKLAPVRQLAGQFGINVATVGKGYDLLRAEGLVRTNRTAGSVIAPGPSDGAWDARAEAAWTARLATVLAEGIAQGETDADVAKAVRDILAAYAAERAANGTGSSASTSPDRADDGRKESR